jgi:uncharacterized repeat protein (TIGR03803 family)
MPAYAANERVLYSFNGGSSGAHPQAGLLAVQGKLYGTTYGDGSARGAGTVFSVTPPGGGEVIHNFTVHGCAGGTRPRANLISVGRALYGTTQEGGASCSSGAVFKLTPAGKETVVYSFALGSRGLDAGLPDAGLLSAGGMFYGTTAAGGGGNCFGGCGTVFALNPSTGVATLLHSFGNTNDGGGPLAALIDVGGTLYGTTYAGGGQLGAGTVFTVTPSGDEKVIYAFKGGSDGAAPSGRLINVDGVLYGTTNFGGAGNSSTGYGTIFSITPAGTETVMYAFKGGRDGAGPQAGLINVGGTLYGTTVNGGHVGSSAPCTSGCGTVFAFNPTTHVETVIYAFKPGIDGANPEAELINIGGTLYGTTYYGGAGTKCNGGCGTVFAVTSK